jgi:hypothetical protein
LSVSFSSVRATGYSSIVEPPQTLWLLSFLSPMIDGFRHKLFASRDATDISPAPDSASA